MSTSSTIEHARKGPSKSRRRKKRRTEDISSSSSSSSSEDEEEIQPNSDSPNEVKTPQSDLKPRADPDIAALDELQTAIQARLKQVPFTDQNAKASRTDPTIQAQEDLVTKHSKERDELDKKFLQLMAQRFGDDLDEARKKPDFNADSLVIMAQTLQSGSNIFDSDEIHELMHEGSSSAGD
ncbi:ribosome assembly protein 3 [Yamadazyma tenuis]|uniref:Ribosome assembly protein 3 n=1 Tax=Candida tenuis (strain ATCC 10573 / BCRC 21748 / CBS 615 / JCM 9827 / NBRC 10315 / NRRL Y-1498 / VKM Y-70) TaxID=590646 RepID=G3BEY3_CANTC|nr:uncharacterized protein CANTEDRAFT_95433 [Yamadazyma tenuis ATCC 10573]EGV59964.1 hypothetical protein CANTEDRAFT_95433 [Yamadazyma tenuis ATCC 10573]WEJ94810.1 ribosome assembly protein 3 [Yamadazyma tenuis]